jgi:3-hydroxyisobutyrate dehydrogenase-like beta-hydroxyacid dehydrogenase
LLQAEAARRLKRLPARSSLLRAGHDVTVYNRTPGKAQGLVDHGAHQAPCLADACRGDAVLTMLADDDAVQAVVFGEDGVLQSLSTGAVHVSMSTISLALCERLAKAHAAAGHRFVAARSSVARTRRHSASS